MTKEEIHALREKSWTKDVALSQLESTEERFDNLLNEHIALQKIVLKLAGDLYGLVKNHSNDPGYKYVNDLKRYQ